MILSIVSSLAFVFCVVEAQKVKVLTVLNEPYTMMNSPGMYEGFVPDILDQIFGGKDYYELSIVEDGKYGLRDATGNFSGMIGKLQRGETDMAAADLTVTEQRMEAAAFTVPFETFSYAALMSKTLKISKNIMMFDDLLKHPDIKYVIVAGGLTEMTLKESKREVYMKIYSEMMKTPAESFLSTMDMALMKIRYPGGNYVLIEESPLIEHMANQMPCDLAVVMNQGDDFKHAFAVKKNDSMLLMKVNAKMTELGDFKLLKEKWWKKSCKDGLNFAHKNLSGSFFVILVAFIVRFLA